MRSAVEELKERIRPWYLRNIYFRAFPTRRPPWFQDAWSFPHESLAQCGSLLDPPGAGSRDFLIFPISDWHARMQRSQMLARCLASLGHRCFLLNPHLGREFPSRGMPPRIARLDRNIYEIHIPLPREPVYHHRMLSGAESTRLSGPIADFLRDHSKTAAQIVCSPVWLGLAKNLKQHCRAPLIYDCHDLLSGFETTAPEIARGEPALIAASDLVLCSSEALHRHCIAAGAAPARCHIVRNAHSEFLSSVASRGSSDRPVIGYVGALEDWFDFDVVSHAARARPGWHFILAGRTESPKASALRALPNIEFRGEIPHVQVPEFLSGIDVGLIPFVLNPLTAAADPIKMYEYLAAGIPVVSSRLPETLRFSGYVRHYEHAESFLAAVSMALDDRSAAARLLRQNAVSRDTWTHRALQTLSLTESLAAPLNS